MKIDDIAKIANVSRSAVSLALNGKNGVSQKTRDKILKIAQENGYIPRSIVKADQYVQANSKILRFVACTNVGIVTEQYESLPFFMELMSNVEEHIGANGYSLMVSSVKVEDLHETLSKLEQEQRSAGIILLGTNLTPDQIDIVSNIQPNLVVMDTCFETMDINFVVMNNIYGAYQAAKHLIELGHSNIGYVESTTRMYNFDMRKNGFLQAISEAGLKIADKNIFTMSPTVISSQETFKDKLKNRLNNLPTALFCECDYMAISTIKSLTEIGIRVPHDISIVGFDNIFESQVITPELTTIHVKKDTIASIAVEKLIRQIENHDFDKVKTVVNTELVVRKSSMQLTKKENVLN
jgi:DNA-binding LacI/PurR family transcriptional regulator